jgi:hypothetical protein
MYSLDVAACGGYCVDIYYGVITSHIYIYKVLRMNHFLRSALPDLLISVLLLKLWKTSGPPLDETAQQVVKRSQPSKSVLTQPRCGTCLQFPKAQRKIITSIVLILRKGG